LLSGVELLTGENEARR